MKLKWIDPRLEDSGFPRTFADRSLSWFETWLDANLNAAYLVYEDGQTLAHYLALAGIHDWTDALSKRGAHLTGLNSLGEAPIHIYAMDANLAGIIALLRNGVDIEQRDGNGGTLLHVACRCTAGHLHAYREPAWPIDGEKISDFIAEILNLAPQLLDLKNKLGQTALFEALQAASCYEPATTVLRKLLSLAANPNAHDADGCTPLHIWAVDCQLIAAAEILLEYGADKTLRNDAGHTPIEVVAKFRYSHKPMPRAISRILNPGGWRNLNGETSV